MSEANKWAEFFGNYKIEGTASDSVRFSDGSEMMLVAGEWIVRQPTGGGTPGTKHDGNKPRWSLLPCGTITAVIAVLEYGAAKYAVDNWMHVDDPKRRYYDAAMRHLESWTIGETNDPESGLPHLAHAACCLLFLIWFDKRDPD